jgi:ribosome biogenesis GTPase
MSGAGIVLASYGRGALVQAESSTLRCGLAGRRLRPVCGDHVRWHYLADGAATVEAVEPRRNVVERIDARGRAEPVAANIDRIAIVVAPEPAPDWFLVDRYWAAASVKEITAVLVVNKLDLGLQTIAAEVQIYRGLGLPCTEVACGTGLGVDALRSALGHGITLLAGQSGVGKSSIVNLLAPGADAQTAQLTRDAEGRHTTTTARWYRLSASAAIIDAPGVRDFAPPAQLMRAAERGFAEVHAAGAACRFNDCRHFDEPGCAVRAGVGDGRIAPRRYESYRRLARLYEGFSGLR